MKRICTILCIAALTAACSKSGPYAGDWVEVNGKDRIRIYAEGGAYVFVDENGKKFPAEVERGLLRVYNPMVTLVGLPSSKDGHLLLAGMEFERSTTPWADTKRTMADIRAIATALEARATDQTSYAIDGKPFTGSIDGAAAALEPTYIKHVPRADGWEHAFAVHTTDRSYEIRSLGANGREDETARGATQNPDCDIVFADGSFVSYPAGANAQ